MLTSLRSAMHSLQSACTPGRWTHSATDTNVAVTLTAVRNVVVQSSHGEDVARAAEHRMHPTHPTMHIIDDVDRFTGQLHETALGVYHAVENRTRLSDEQARFAACNTAHCILLNEIALWRRGFPGDARFIDATKTILRETWLRPPGRDPLSPAAYGAVDAPRAGRSRDDAPFEERINLLAIVTTAIKTAQAFKSHRRLSPSDRAFLADLDHHHRLLGACRAWYVACHGHDVDENKPLFRACREIGDLCRAVQDSTSERSRADRQDDRATCGQRWRQRFHELFIGCWRDVRRGSAQSISLAPPSAHPAPPEVDHFPLAAAQIEKFVHALDALATTIRTRTTRGTDVPPGYARFSFHCSAHFQLLRQIGEWRDAIPASFLCASGAIASAKTAMIGLQAARRQHPLREAGEGRINAQGAADAPIDEDSIQALTAELEKLLIVEMAIGAATKVQSGQCPNRSESAFIKNLTANTALLRALKEWHDCVSIRDSADTDGASATSAIARACAAAESLDSPSTASTSAFALRLEPTEDPWQNRGAPWPRRRT